MNRRSLPLLVLLALIWGSSFMFIKIAVRELDPATLVLGRLGLAAVALGIVVLARRSGVVRRSPSCARTGPALAVVGLLNTAVPVLAALLGRDADRLRPRVDHPGVGADLQRAARVRLLPRAAGERAPARRRRGRVRRRRAARRRPAAGEDPRRARRRRHGDVLRRRRSARRGTTWPTSARRSSRFGTTAVAALAVAARGRRSGAAPRAALEDRLRRSPCSGSSRRRSPTCSSSRSSPSAGAGYASLVTYLVPPIALVYGALFLGESVGVAALAGLVLILGGVALGTRTRKAAPPAVGPAAAELS